MYSTIETLVEAHYSQLKNRLHILRVNCGQELAQTMALLKGICPLFGPFHPSLGLLLASDKKNFFHAVQGTIQRANYIVKEFYENKHNDNSVVEIFAVGDCVGGLLMYEAFSKRTSHNSNIVFPKNRQEHLPIFRNTSSTSNQLNDTNSTENELTV